MKCEHGAGTRLGIKPVRETGFRAGGLIREGQRVAPARQAFGKAFGVLGRLDLDAAQDRAGLLGLYHTGGAAIYVEEIIGEPVAGQRKLAYGHAAVGRDVGLVDVTDVPARLDEQLIDLPSGVLFRIPHLPSFRLCSCDCVLCASIPRHGS